MSNPADTNQASEDELQEELRKIIWYELGDGLNGTDVDECAVTLLNIIRTEKLKLLAEVRERVVGEDEVGLIDDPDSPAYGERYVNAMADKDEQRAELDKLEAEL